MDDFELPDDLKDSVDVVYLDDDEAVEEMDDFDEGNNEESGIEAVVIDLSALTFSKHNGSVFMSDLNGDDSMALTGGEDDMAYLWNFNTGEILLECTGHKDSVTELAFSYDNQYIATGDMGGLIQVWSVKDMKLIWCYEGDDLGWMCWHNQANILLSGSNTGEIYIYQIPAGNFKVLASHGSQSTCGKLMPDGKRLVSGYSDGIIKMWDLKNTSVVWQYTSPTLESINSVEISPDGTLMCVCPTGELIKTHDGKLLSVLLIQGEKDIEVCKFNAEFGVLATGALSGQICVWEIGKNTLRHQAKIECEVTIIQFGKNSKLLIGGTDGAIYVCDIRSGSLIETLTGHHDGILSICVSKTGSYVLSTSDDGTAKKFMLKDN